jgi:hypothetical protein
VSAILVGVLSYIAVAGSIEGIGHDRYVAVIGDDGDRSAVIGTGNIGDDLTEQIGLPNPGVDADERLEHLTRGMSYFLLIGPYTFEGDLSDLPAVAATYGLAA